MFLFLGHVTHFCLQRHFTGKHEGSLRSQRSIVVKSPCAQKVSFDGIPASARRDQVSLKHFQVDQGNEDPLTSHPILQMDADTADHFAHGGWAQPNAHGHVMGSRRRPHVWHGQRDHHLFAVEGGLLCRRSCLHSHK